MNTPLSNENFGLVIAYVLPGFVALWGVSYFSPTVESWITATQQGAPSVAGFMYVTVASLAAGLTVSAVRWAIIDTIHHATGVKPPAWEFAVLNDKLPGFLGLVENHYRYYQHHSNMFVAVALSYSARWIVEGSHPGHWPWLPAGFAVLEIVFFAASRDSLCKYYTRAGRLLHPVSPEERITDMSNGFGHHPEPPEKAPRKKPETVHPKPKVKKSPQPKAR